MVTVVTDRTGLLDSVRETLFKGAGVNLFKASVRESTGTDTSSLHKMAVWSDASPWCRFIQMKMKMLSFCLENAKSSRWPWL